MIRKINALMLIMLLGVAGAVQAAVTPVFEYSFPASFDGTGKTVTDLSGAGNHAAMKNSDRTLIDDRPAGFDVLLMSISGSNGNYGRTDTTHLLNTTAVATAGGFVFDTWIQWDGNTSGSQKVIDYAATESLRMYNGELDFTLSNAAFRIKTTISANTWYHVMAIFDTQGNTPYVGNYDPQLDVTGQMSLYIDGVLIDSKAAIKTGWGDALSGRLSFNSNTSLSYEFWNGRQFNPSVYLGIPELPVRLVNPSDGTNYISIDNELTLKWISGTDPAIIEHVLYFGTDESWVANALPTDPAAIVLPVETETYQHPEPLEYETRYFWRIDEATGDLSNPDNVETGPVWSFTTPSPPLPPCAFRRFDGDVDGDCYVDFNDLCLVVQGWLLTETGLDADIDEDNKVNLVDFAYLQRDWFGNAPMPTILVISAHPDDEGIFFGGALPYYSQVLGAKTMHISMTSGDYQLEPEFREAELTNADAIYFGQDPNDIRTSIGLPPDPTADLFFPRFKDAPGTLDSVWDYWNDGVLDYDDVAEGKQKAIDTVATYIRILKPDVIITHDFDGEYGHGNHKATAIAVADAYDQAADPSYVDGNDPWQALKLYVHQSEANGLGTSGRTFEGGWLFHHYWEEATIDLDNDEILDMTPRQVADLGLDEHVSQGQHLPSTVYLIDERFDGHHSEWWGLYRTEVGPDSIAEPFTIMGKAYNDGVNNNWARGNFFENL